MIAQGVPIGLNFASPTFWFFSLVVLIVLVLTVSTRRSNARPRNAFPLRPVAPQVTPVAPDEDAAWMQAQIRFVEDPRAGCERAQALMLELLRERDATSDTSTTPAVPNALDGTLHAATEILRDPAASTEDLRRAFVGFRAVFEALRRR